MRPLLLSLSCEGSASSSSRSAAFPLKGGLRGKRDEHSARHVAPAGSTPTPSALRFAHGRAHRAACIRNCTAQARAARTLSRLLLFLHSDSAKDHTTNRARKLSSSDRIVGAMTLAPLKNTQPEPAPTEDTSAVTQEQASSQEQLARSNPRRHPRTLL